MTVVPRAKHARGGHHRELVNQRGNQSPLHRSAVQTAVADEQISRRFSLASVFIQERDVCSHIPADPQKSVPGGIDTYVPDEDLGSLYQKPCGNKIGGGRNIAGYADLLCMERRFRLYGGGGAFRFYRGAEMPQEDLGVVP